MFLLPFAAFCTILSVQFSLSSIQVSQPPVAGDLDSFLIVGERFRTVAIENCLIDLYLIHCSYLHIATHVLVNAIHMLHGP